MVWFGGGAVAAEVDEDDGVFLSQRWHDAVPDMVALRKAVDEEQRR